MSKGYTNKRQREYDLNISLHYALRRGAYLSFLPHTKDGALTLERFAREFWQLPGDNFKAEPAPVVTVESFKEARANMLRNLQKSRRKVNKKIVKNAGT